MQISVIAVRLEVTVVGGSSQVEWPSHITPSSHRLIIKKKLGEAFGVGCFEIRCVSCLFGRFRAGPSVFNFLILSLFLISFSIRSEREGHPVYF